MIVYTTMQRECYPGAFNIKLYFMWKYTEGSYKKCTDLNAFYSQMCFDIFFFWGNSILSKYESKGQQFVVYEWIIENLVQSGQKKPIISISPFDFSLLNNLMELENLKSTATLGLVSK